MIDQPWDDMDEDAGVPVGVVQRRTGVSVHQLRRWHQRGWLAPSRVDSTGHRRYTRADIRTARLLASLTSTGMDVARAAVVVAGGDREAIDDHLAATAARLETVRRLAPDPRVQAVRRRTLPSERGLVMPLEGERASFDDAVRALGVWQAQCAAARTCGVHELPRAARGPGLPDGPAVIC